MEKIGTDYGGWFIPLKPLLNQNSIIYSVGAGEDISFDLQIQSKYKCNIIIVDPTARAIKHFEEIKDYFNSDCSNKNIFTGDIQKDYIANIQDLKPNFDKIQFVPLGLYDRNATLKFFKQDNEKYVSQSLESNMFGQKYDLVDVVTLKDLMNKLNHDKIDMLKLDIEGSECAVLEQMLNEKIYPKYLCIEFDLLLKNKDVSNKTQHVVNNLLSVGYKLLKNDNYNITFSRE